MHIDSRPVHHGAFSRHAAIPNDGNYPDEKGDPLSSCPGFFFCCIACLISQDDRGHDSQCDDADNRHVEKMEAQGEMVIGEQRTRTGSQRHANAKSRMEGGHDRLLIFSFDKYRLAVHRYIHRPGKETRHEKAHTADPDILGIRNEGYDTTE